MPWFFRPAEIFVERPWCIVHAILIVFNILIYHSSQEFYPAYLHATYKISTHLGEWEEIGGEIDSDTMIWKDGERYFQGLIVAYKERLLSLWPIFDGPGVNCEILTVTDRVGTFNVLRFRDC